VQVYSGDGGAGAVTYPAATATDDVTPSPALSYSVASGSPFPLGDTPVTVTATDDAGNTATCSFTVHVIDSSNQPPFGIGCGCQGGAGSVAWLATALAALALPWLRRRAPPRRAAKVTP
ncbi:MAG TPA: HYR domain-containing protein, partial [Myxococcales bacterium]|nr:HYR domain-containing protein [Myxococcales bacterium]